MTMRGSNFEQVLVMVDGVPFGNPQTGHFNTDFPFSVRDVETSLSILKGRHHFDLSLFYRDQRNTIDWVKVSSSSSWRLSTSKMG
jgi:outer membrane cobalamin receptor